MNISYRAFEAKQQKRQFIMCKRKQALAFPEVLYIVLKFYLWETNIKPKLPLFAFASKGKLDMATL